MSLRLAFSLLLGFYATVVVGLRAADPAPAADLTRLVCDLRSADAVVESYGSWQDHVVPTKTGLTVLGSKGADGKGGLGHALSPALDLSGEAYVEVALATGQKNAVGVVTIGFSDENQTQYTATIRIDQIVPLQPVWMRVRLADFALNNWQANKSPKKIDWSKITHWDLQGDWKTTDAAHFLLMAIRTRR